MRTGWTAPVLRMLYPLVLGALLCPARTDAGTICGIVRNSTTLRPIERAGVFVREPAGSYTGLYGATDATGSFCIDGVAPGTYDLEVRRDDFLVGWLRGIVVTDETGDLNVIVNGSEGLQVEFRSPTSGTMSISWWMPRAGPVQLVIYDLRGRLVHGWEATAIGAGSHTTSWSGLDRNGRPVPSGIYFVRLTSGSLGQVRKLIRLS